jgi:hypothetical protein
LDAFRNRRVGLRRRAYVKILTYALYMNDKQDVRTCRVGASAKLSKVG